MTDLTTHNTFRVPARCGALLRLDNPAALPTLRFDPKRDLVLGDGSNVLLAGDVPGTVLLNRLPGRHILDQDGDTARVFAGAGEDWHALVRWTLDQGLSGLENLSLIPGRVGAAPMQNIGAYGVELAEHLDAVHTWDWAQQKHRRMPASECAFAYRDSRFKSREPDRFLITGLELRLDRRFRPRLAYAGLREELAAAGVATPTARAVSEAVVRLRRRKLPDPATIGNAGSFFKNPVVSEATAARLADVYPALPLHRTDGDGAKASAAWMIEHCGWKGFRAGDAGVSERHALVLVNHGRASGDEIHALAERIRTDVQATFGISLEAEPRTIRRMAD